MNVVGVNAASAYEACARGVGECASGLSEILLVFRFGTTAESFVVSRDEFSWCSYRSIYLQVS